MAAHKHSKQWESIVFDKQAGREVTITIILINQYSVFSSLAQRLRALLEILRIQGCHTHFAVILFLPLNNQTNIPTVSISVKRFLISSHCVHDSSLSFLPPEFFSVRVMFCWFKEEETVTEIIHARGWGCCNHRLIIEVGKMNALCHFYYLGEIWHIRLLKINLQPKNQTNIPGSTATLHLKCSPSALPVNRTL